MGTNAAQTTRITGSGNGGPRQRAALKHERELVAAVQRLSLARSLADIQRVVRTFARRLTGADGATFVLRDGDLCHYADEDAISPLWKGQRFALDHCISGWAMLNRKAVAIEDIYADERIPHDAYRPTFVRSLAMVPIRTLDPIGAIGTYWAQMHRPSEHDLELLQALADSTAVAMENVRMLEELEDRVADRTAELLARTRELEETNRSIRLLLEESSRGFEELKARRDHHLQALRTLAHEVRTPLAGAHGLIRLVLMDADGLAPEVISDLHDIDGAVSEALEVVGRQLQAARLDAGAIQVRPVQVELAGELAALRATLRAFRLPGAVELIVEAPAEELRVCTDRGLLGHVLRNLVGNALKFTDRGEVRVRAHAAPRGGVAISVADTGIGIADADRSRIFEEWQQLDGDSDGSGADRPAGSGLGLPLAARLVAALGGNIDVESAVGRGSTFTVRLPPRAPAAQ